MISTVDKCKYIFMLSELESSHQIHQYVLFGECDTHTGGFTILSNKSRVFYDIGLICTLTSVITDTMLSLSTSLVLSKTCWDKLPASELSDSTLMFWLERAPMVVRCKPARERTAGSSTFNPSERRQACHTVSFYEAACGEDYSRA